jgi:UDP:flavonoid glycosyltransferase YjiC (YdhE family)
VSLIHRTAILWIIPYIIDQFVWNKIVADLGAGPRGIRIDKVKTGNLEDRIKQLINDPSYKKNSLNR